MQRGELVSVMDLSPADAISFLVMALRSMLGFIALL